MSDKDLAPSAQDMQDKACVTFDDVLELLSVRFTVDDSSPRHARLNVELPEGMQPVMVYRGSSSLEVSRAVVNIASPLLGIDDNKIYDIASLMDTMPLGALRRLGGIMHIHEALAFGEFGDDTLIAYTRLIAAQALSLRLEGSDGKQSGDGEQNEGEQ